MRRILFNVSSTVRKSEFVRMWNSHRIRAATSIHKLHCKKFFQIGKET
ncbi:hypothetical protein LEP1GSC068_4061 [Leptospira sp. Fiocruz LV3954]|nr:hypothetical protein LEP1GSC068_4061 [Leptospira sp. Fiocruz LV3954]EMI69756.1 hypothetical protein LEP1GSC076_3391 [Leptospira sp. Fiocruz LV4135]